MLQKLSLKRTRWLANGVFIFALLLTDCCALAGFVWEQPAREFTTKPGEEIFRTAYCFTNTGNRTVSIASIKPSCGCVTTALAKFDYAPGEGGEIKVVFDLGMDEFATLQKRTIQVVTSDAPEKPVVLQLVVHVPETVRVSPEIVIWHRSEQPKTREVIVQAGLNIEPFELEQTTANDNFTVVVKPDASRKKYRIKITPVKTDAPSYAELKFNVKSASFKRRVVCEVHMNVE